MLYPDEPWWNQLFMHYAICLKVIVRSDGHRLVSVKSQQPHFLSMQSKKPESTSLSDQANSEKKFTTLIFCLKVLLWANTVGVFFNFYSKMNEIGASINVN